MKTRAIFSLVCMSMLAPFAANAAEVTVNGIKYKDPIAAVSDFRRLIDNRLNQVVPNYFNGQGISRIGGRFVVVTPTVSDAVAKYVWTKGWIKPSRETQEVIAQTEIIRIESNFRLMERAQFIESARFVSEDVHNSSDDVNADYVVTLRCDFDGDRTQRGVQFRTTDYILTSTRTGRQTVVLTVVGSPSGLSDLYLFKQFEAAVGRVS